MGTKRGRGDTKTSARTSTTGRRFPAERPSAWQRQVRRLRQWQRVNGHVLRLSLLGGSVWLLNRAVPSRSVFRMVM